MSISTVIANWTPRRSEESRIEEAETGNQTCFSLSVIFYYLATDIWKTKAKCQRFVGDTII